MTDRLTEIKEVAQFATDRGMSVIPLLTNKKKPGSKDGTALANWQTGTFTADDFTEKTLNIGMRWDPPYVDIDLDCTEARKIAPMVLPKTRMWGRKSLPRSHYLYKVDGNLPYKAFTSDSDVGDGNMILEIRAGSGHQSMVPPSIHPSGEEVTWEDTETAVTISNPDELFEEVRLVAILSLFLRHWVSGKRDLLSCCLASILMRNLGHGVDKASAMIEIVCRLAGDEQIKMRTNKATRTDNGKKMIGLPNLKEGMGADAEKIKDWLATESSSEESIDFDGMVPNDVWHSLPPAPELKRGMVPDRVFNLSRDLARQKGIEHDFALIPMLCAISAATGIHRRIKPRDDDDWDTSSIIWGCLIANSGTGKSTPLSQITEPLRKIEKEEFEEYEKARAAQADAMNEAARGDRQAAREHNAPRPVVHRYLTDTTIEALVVALGNSPGLFLVREELAGLFDGFDQYKKSGNEQTYYLQLYDGGTIVVIRKVSGDLFVPMTHCAVFGTIQPTVAARVLITSENKGNGMAARFNLMAYPSGNFVPAERVKLNEDDVKWYKNIILAMCSDPGHCVFEFEDSDIFFDWMNKEKRANHSRAEPYRTHCAKYIGLTARIALLFHLIESPFDGFTDAGGELRLDPATRIPTRIFEMAVKFVERYLYSMLPRVYSVPDLSEAGAEEGKLLARAILDKRKELEPIGWLNLSAVTRWGRTGLGQKASVVGAFNWLAGQGWGYLEPESQTRGRRATRFFINPKVFENF